MISENFSKSSADTLKVVFTMTIDPEFWKISKKMTLTGPCK